MIQKIKNVMLVAASLFAVAVPVMVPASAFAQADVQSNLCDGSNFQIDSNSGTSTSCATQQGQGLNDLLKKIVNIISAVVGVVAVIMIIVGGFKYITSGGDSNNVSGAKNTIIYAIIGLVIVALAQVIVHFVLDAVPS